MFTIEYDVENGRAISDVDSEAYVLLLQKDYEEYVDNKNSLHSHGLDEFFYHVSTENVITAARVLVKETGLKVQFKFGDKVLVPNSEGRLEEWPDGFCDYNDNWLDRLLD